MLNIGRGHRYLLLNRADDAVGIGAEKVETILGMNVASQISTSIDIAAATNAGTPIIAASPNHPSSAAFRNLSALLVGEPQTAADAGPRAPRRTPTTTGSPSSSGSRGDIVSSLAERLAAARKQTRERRHAADASARPEGPGRPPEPTQIAAAAAPAGDGGERRRDRRVRHARRQPLDATSPRRRTVAAAPSTSGSRSSSTTCTASCSSSSGPQLYDANLDQADLDHRVRAVLAQLMSSQERPISNADRNRLTQEISDDILGYGPIEPFLRDVDVSEVMVNGPDSIWLERDGKLVKANAHVQRRGPRAPHDRQDRLPHRPPRRRVEPDGGRPPP